MVNTAEVPQADKNTDAAEIEVVPRQFGRYTLLSRLAVGGMAELFLALQRSVAGFEKLIVIKRILPSMNQDQAFIDMLLHEARVAATLSHPNIVQIFDVGKAENMYFIAMEHIHGEDLQTIVRAMRKKDLPEFPLEHALTVMTSVCAALSYAHEKRDLDGESLSIVHRDVSPRNILVSFSGDVKIVDFGIAKSGYTATEDTISPQIKGKVPYMSPEQASGRQLDHRSDIFSAGIVLFELTTGKRLFRGSSEFVTLTMICENEYPKPSEVRPGYPPRLERIVMRALAKDVKERYQSARQMQADLEAFILEERIQTSQVNLSNWMQSLFGDKLAEQKEALQDVKQLADVIAAQALAAERAAAAKPSAFPSSRTGHPPEGMAAPPEAPARRSVLPWIIAVAVVIGAGGYFYQYNRHLDGLREALAAAHKQQSASEGGVVGKGRGTLDINSQPEGCAIWINGDLREETTPAKIDRLPFGREIKIKLTKEGFEAHREAVTLSEGEPSRDLDVVLKAGSVTLVLQIEPPPAVWLDGKLWKGDKTKIEGVSAGEEHKLVVSANGYQAKTYTFTAQQGETKAFADQLVRADAEPLPKKDEKSAAPFLPSLPGPARVRITSRGGACYARVNGIAVGTTPVEAAVTSGPIEVSCKPSVGATLQQTVRVEPGETARVAFNID